MTISTKVMPVGLLCAASVWGCAETVPKELADARAAYDRASHGPAQQWSPADLHGAQTALETAESAYDEEGDSPNTRDLGYVALRKTQIAEAKARTLAAKNQAEQAEARAEQQKSEQHAQTVEELNATRQQLEGQTNALSAEQQKRAEAEKRAQAAMAELGRVAAVKQEARGTVITLSGSVLFESGEANLLPGAETRLSQVADALTSRDPDSPIVVEGYTDSQGSRRFNERLSKERAESVRTYLISKGVAPDRIRAAGMGPDKPVADNSSPEGRANNRRVEIVVDGQGSAPSGI
jgi:outer membrane protein OmpA-like peptidoglycan-associated protein